MADIILPDDVFVNMQNAQEEAKSMKEAVTEFNKNVSEKFTDKDANKDAKVENDVNPRLTTNEKTRYRNIGSAFFEGAKTQILDIFKEIEKTKKKNIFKRTTAAVREQMEQIKEFAEEHKTHGKILLAIAAIGGIYYLFKDWFDENMPKIWDKLTKAITEFADAAGKLASEIATKITDSNILVSIRDFIVKTGDEIAGFFKTLGDRLKSVFTVFNSDKINAPTYNYVEKEKAYQDEFNKKDELTKLLINNADTKIEERGPDGRKTRRNISFGALNDKIMSLSEDLDELVKAKDNGEKYHTFKDGRELHVDAAINNLTNQLEPLIKAREKMAGEAEGFMPGLMEYLQDVLKNADPNSSIGSAKKAYDSGDIRKAIAEFAKTEHLQDYLRGYLDKVDPEHLGGLADAFKDILETLKENPDYDVERDAPWWDFFGTKKNNFKKIPMLEKITGQILTAWGNNGKTPDKINDENKKAEEDAAKKARENEKRIQNANLTKLTNVAVISTLDEFVKNFFDGDQPGSFKVFSKQFLDSVKQIAGSFEIAKNIGVHVENIYNKVNGVIDSITKNLEEIGTALSTNTDSIKTFIADRFKNEGISQLADRLDNILKEEAKQVSFLSQQNSILEQTNKLLETMQPGNNANVSITPATAQNDGFSIDDTPTANSMAINNMYVAGAGLA